MSTSSRTSAFLLDTSLHNQPIPGSRNFQTKKNKGVESKASLDDSATAMEGTKSTGSNDSSSLDDNAHHDSRDDQAARSMQHSKQHSTQISEIGRAHV